MWYPGQSFSQALNREVIELFMAALNNDEIKNELRKHIRVELDTQRTKYSGTVQSYESLTSGNVNMQAKMAASGYDVYGRTILTANQDATNQNVYKKIKNQIHYGRSPQHGYYNRGSYSVI